MIVILLLEPAELASEVFYMLSSDDTLTASVTDPASGCRVYFEDDGRVAYAYLVAADGQIIADVWLYNRGKAPAEPEWHDNETMPFANPAEFVRTDKPFNFAKRPSDITVLWEASEQYGLVARIYIHNELFGILTPGAKPGWSVLATRDGPLAQKFTSSFGGSPD
ncbi:hypothetical protein [Rhizobium sp. RCC_161_2]|uniref:hypothetical protein n=1 Tax=Rhizobium sp. RCC_161_2 TaxID=3239219 RepID=UPI003526692F